MMVWTDTFAPRRAALILMAMILALGLWACGEDEEPEPEPTAQAFFLHNNPQQGPLEVRLEDTVVLPSIEPGALRTKAISLAPGSGTMAVRAPGAAADLFSQAVTLEAQPYLFILNAGDITVETAAPPAEITEGALRLVDLSGLSLDVYANGVQLGSAFVEVPAGDVTVAVYNKDVDPMASVPVATTTTSLPTGKAAMILMRNDGMTPPSVTLDPLGL